MNFIPKSLRIHVRKNVARIRNDRQAVFQLVGCLVQTQFDLGEKELAKKTLAGCLMQRY